MVSQGMAILLTTHYLEEAQYLAYRVAIMDCGRIVKHGSVEGSEVTCGTMLCQPPIAPRGSGGRPPGKMTTDKREEARLR